MKKLKYIKMIFSIILMILNIISICFLSYSIILYDGVETFYRIFGILFLSYFLILMSYLLIRNALSKKHVPFVILSVLTLIFVAVEFTGYYYLNKLYKTIDSYSTVENQYSSSLITYDNNLKDYKDLQNKKIGIITDEEDIEGYILPNEIINNLKLEESNEIIEYTSTMDLLYAFKKKEIDAAFFSSNYVDMFSSIEEFETIETDTKVLYSEDKIIESIEEDIKKETSSLTKPFSVLIIGVDSSKDGVTSGYNADVLLLLTFNPQTLNATLTSVPRDMYLQTACSGNAYRRINTTTWGSSSSCAVKTIEKLFDVDIDYYAKINFKGVVQLVDSLGGITVDVPYSFCEQNSSRSWGKNTVFVEKGIQTLNGEQALALARNRHKPNDGSAAGKEMGIYCPSYNEGSRNDYTRGKSQIKLIQAIISKATELRDPDQALEILQKVKANFQTNVTTNDLLSLYSLGKSIVISDGTNLINIKQLQLTGQSVFRKVYEESSHSYPAVTMPYQESINAIKKEININQGKTTKKEIKSIKFDINNPYESEVIGKGKYSKINLQTLKDLSSYSVPSIKNYANEINKTLKFIDSETNQIIDLNDYTEYTFLYQKEHKDVILNQIKEINIYVKKKGNTNISAPEENTPNDDENTNTEENNNTNDETNTEPEKPPVDLPPELDPSTSSQ